MKNIFILISCFILMPLMNSLGQNYNVFDLYNNNYTLVNPAFVGNEGVNKISTSGKLDWGSYSLMSYERAIDKLNSGIGFTIGNVNTGIVNVMNYNLLYSYKIDFKDSSYLRIGTNLTYLKRNYFEGYYLFNQNGNIDYDFKPKPTYSLGLGLWYERKKMFAGFSTDYIYKSASDFESNRLFHIVFGYKNVKINNFLTGTISSNLILTKNISNIDFNGSIEFKKRIILGLINRNLNYSFGNNDLYYHNLVLSTGFKFLKTSQFLFNLYNLPLNYSRVDNNFNGEIMLKMVF